MRLATARTSRASRSLLRPERARRLSATPKRDVAPPASASSGGVSPSSNHASTIEIGGARYASAASRAASLRASAYAHVVKPIAGGETPRDASQARLAAGGGAGPPREGGRKGARPG